MRKTAFVCYGNSPRDRAFVYNEIPRNEKGEEFFVFILPGNPRWSAKLREFFRIAISTSRMGSSRSYFIRLLSNIRESLTAEADLKEIFSGSIILFLIKRGNEIYFLHNRELNIVCGDSSNQSGDIYRLTAIENLTENINKGQPDLFNKSIEELFLLRKVRELPEKHTLIFTPSAEFADRYGELFLDSVFFPSFEVPDSGGIRVGTDLHLPSIHWNFKDSGNVTKEKRLNMNKMRKVSIPAVSGILAAVLAAVIFFWPFADKTKKENNNQKENVLLSAGDISENIDSENRSSNNINGNGDGSIDESSGPEITGSEQKYTVKQQEDSGLKESGNKLADIALKSAWKKKFSRPVTSSPVLCGKNIIFGCRDGFLYSFSQRGDFIWKYNLGAGVGSSPLCSKEGEVFGCDYEGNVVCLNSEDGSLNWENSLGSKIISTPSITGDFLITGTMTGDLHSVNVRSGKKVWRKHLGSAIWSSIVTGDDYIITATVDGHLIKLDLEGNILWTVDPGGEIYSTPICSENDDLVIIGTNNKLISGFSFSEGSLLWQHNAIGKVRSTPATDGKRVIIGTESGMIYSLNMSGKILWMQDIGRVVRSKPVIHKEVVFITGYNTKLSAIDIKTGNIIDTYSTGSAIYSSPLFFNGKIYFGSNNGLFHSIDITEND
ncbi:MAG: PQQ-binding-like beta-propeller repeat protein [Candidatus Krumholzibacteriota bacterium]|nr:PQQ-binding-like beta-propeller repeat protein [Candidatus Krumholzibacteriota bacterium]